MTKKFNLKPIHKPTTAKEMAYSEIKKVILNGHISSEDIFTEVQMAELLNTSRTPVREALRDLIKEGLISVIPRKGMSIRKVSESEVEQIFLLRSTIEGEVVKKVTREFAPRQLAQLKSICDQQREAMQAEDDLLFIHLDQKFHTTLVKFSKYELIEQILLNLHNLSQLIGLKAIKKRNRMEEVLEEHLAILENMENRNEEQAVLSMSEHLQRTKQSLYVQP